MSMQDPIADMLTRIRNAGAAGLKQVAMPGSREKAAIAAVLKSEGYVKDFAVAEDGAKRRLVIELKVHSGSREIPRVRNGLGTVVLTTPKGIMSGRQAAKENVGGEILCYVW